MRLADASQKGRNSGWIKRTGAQWLTQINDELSNLEPGDPFLPPNANATGALEIVPVHDNMDQEVKGDRDPGNSSISDQLSIA